MQFIELLFGFSPDGGTGFLEICLISLPFVAVIAVKWVRKSRSRLPDQNG